MPVHNIPHISPASIYLASTDGIPLNQYGNRISFPLKNAVVVPNNCQAFCSLASFRFSNVFYNIDQFHQKLYYSLSNEIDTVLEYIIPAGNYSITTLLDRLNADLADHFFVFTYDPQTFKITISNTEFGFIFHAGQHSANRELGLRVPTPQATQHTAHGCIQLGGVPAITISVPTLHLDSNGSAGSENSVLDRVTNSVLTGQTMSYNDSASNKYRIYESAFSTIEIHLTNQGLDLDFLGSTWFINLHIVFVYTPNYIPELSNFPVAPSLRLEATAAPTAEPPLITTAPDLTDE